jgi:SAM-dependent methyltransferase
MEEVYRRRDRLHPRNYYSLRQPGHLYLTHVRERLLLRALREAGIGDLSDLQLLDVGCGAGEWLLRFETYGARLENLVGVELQRPFLREARARSDRLRVVQADGARLPFGPASFDLVHQATMMTLVPEAGLRRQIAAEMLRVLKPEGSILWFDMRYSNPRNPDMRGIGRRELGRLFPGCRMRLRSASLLPTVARRLAPWSFLACSLLELLPPLRIHYLGTIQPLPTNRPGRTPVAKPGDGR